MLKMTALHSRHQALGARLVDFAGWEMPIQYQSQLEEHHAVRQAVGMFDVAHMQAVDLRGPRVREFLRNVEAYYQPWYSPEVRQTLSAYALYVRYLMGDLDPAKARQVYAQLPLDDASLEALAWLWQVMGQDPGSAEQAAEIARRINNSAVDTAMVRLANAPMLSLPFVIANAARVASTKNTASARPPSSEVAATSATLTRCPCVSSPMVCRALVEGVLEVGSRTKATLRPARRCRSDHTVP